MLAVADTADSIDYYQHTINTRSTTINTINRFVRFMDWVAGQMGGDGPLRSGFGLLRGGVGPLRGSQLTTVFTTCAATWHCGTTAVQSSFLKPSSYTTVQYTFENRDLSHCRTHSLHPQGWLRRWLV